MSSRTGRLFLILLSALVVLSPLLIATLLSSSGNTTPGAPAGTPTTTPQTDAGNEYAIKVFWNGQQVALLSFDDLLQLPQIDVVADGKPQEGPTLLSVLQLAGIREFSQVKASGLCRGRIASAELVLNRADITDEVILDKTNIGTTKLCGPDIPYNNWIIDVNELAVT